MYAMPRRHLSPGALATTRESCRYQSQTGTARRSGAACGADQNAVVEPTAAMPTDGPDQGVTSGTPIPGQGGLTDDPEADQPVVTTPQPGAAGEGDPVTTTLSDIDENPAAFAGQTVTIEGTAAEVFGPRSFAIGDVAAGVGPLLVVGGGPDVFPSELTAGANPNLMVQVTGDVRSFNLPAFGSDLRHDLDDALFADWGERTVIIADTITPVARYYPLAGGTPPPWEAPEKQLRQ